MGLGFGYATLLRRLNKPKIKLAKTRDPRCHDQFSFT
jgi:hypothetical protein